MNTSKRIDIVTMWIVALTLLLQGCAPAGPAFGPNQIIPMANGSALTIFQNAANGLSGARMLGGQIPGGYGWIAIQPYEGWFGVVLTSTTGKCGGLCLQKMLDLTGQAMETVTLKDLVARAESLGFQAYKPEELPLWIRMVAGVAKASLVAQTATGWILVVPFASFEFAPGYNPVIDS